MLLPLSWAIHIVSGFFPVEVSYRINPTVFMDYKVFLLDEFLVVAFLEMCFL